MTSVYITHVKTFSIAQELADNHNQITAVESDDILETCSVAPYCLRFIREHRGHSTTAFRNLVAKEAWRQRKATV